MITVISGSNRPMSNTRKIAALVHEILADAGEAVDIIDLTELPMEIFAGSSYASKPRSFSAFQEKIFRADGLVTVVPEYNGSFPGVLKYFIDMLSFPESLHEKPAAFVGIASGRWGGVRAVEHLEMVFQYRNAHLFGRRCFIPDIRRVLDDADQITDPDVAVRLRSVTLDFAGFCRKFQKGRVD